MKTVSDATQKSKASLHTPPAEGRHKNSMTVFVCIDERGGMTFNGRRQSRDSEVMSDIKKSCEKGLLLASAFSEKMLTAEGLSAKIVDDPLSNAGEGDFVFIENLPLIPHLDRIKKLIIYHWNRHYPSDRKLDVDVSSHGFRLISSREFKGSSHEKITREDYGR